MSQFHQVFFDETEEHLASMESLLLALPIESPDPEDLNAIFRAAHSIKGGAATFGFDDLADLTHVLENLLDRIRKGTMPLTRESVDIFLRAKDMLADMLGAHRGGDAADADAVNRVKEELVRIAQSQDGGAGEAVPDDAPAAASGGMTHTLSIEISAGAEGVESLLESLALEGDLTILKRPSEDDSSPWVVRLVGALDAGEAAETLAFALVPEAFHVVAGSALEESDGFGLFLDESSDSLAAPVTAATGNETVEDDSGFGLFEPLPATGDTETGIEGFGLFDAVSAPEPQRKTEPVPAASAAQPQTAGHPGAKGGENSIRVNIEKVDLLLNLVGELVITQSMLMQSGSRLDPAEHERLLDGIGQLERNSRELQEAVMSIRMTPISFVFNRFPRVVRDLTARLDKEVELKMIGENTELDKGFIEKLSDPLTHLVRNSLDHGIESPEERSRKGKPPVGRLTLRAFHQGGSIVIEVTDDGAGLDRERILAKARERGMTVSEALSDNEVWNLIFEPGFSTASVVTDVSGRGVGMDVVKRNIMSMGGHVDIDSLKDFGTTISIRLPLTLAIMDGMSVRIGEEIYILPLSFILESLQPPTSDVYTVSGKGLVVNVRGEYLPIVHLAGLFEVSGGKATPSEGILVIVECDESRLALMVDELIGQQQFVVKNLETNYHKVDGISGATILGDGQVALILDVTTIVRSNQKQALAANGGMATVAGLA
ncbi:chemotaxis protein CheW [Paludibacterium paludis]|nr:chemotaxis protein CheW [Paludibacterium paludis]